MDDDRFDNLIRSLTDHPSRRRVLGLSLGGGLAALLGLLDAEAKRKKRKKKTRKKCQPQCSGKTCGDDGCGGSCGQCEGNCCDGQCRTPIQCHEVACGCDEVCHSGSGGIACEGGGCAETDWCVSSDTYFCGSYPNCNCATSIDDVTVCADFLTQQCHTCDSDADCTTALGREAVCLTPGQWCGCSGGTSCVAVGCPGGAPRRGDGRSGRGRSSKLKLAP